MFYTFVKNYLWTDGVPACVNEFSISYICTKHVFPHGSVIIGMTPDQITSSPNWILGKYFSA